MAEEGLTPYQDWTTGELKGKDAGLDLGLRGDRSQRETAPGATMAPAKREAPRIVEVAGETREQRDLRLFLASGEAKAQLDAKRGGGGGGGKSAGARLGSERPGSERPGSERPSSSRPASERPASERFAEKGAAKGKPVGGGATSTAPQSEKSKRKDMFKNF